MEGGSKASTPPAVTGRVQIPVTHENSGNSEVLWESVLTDGVGSLLAVTSLS
jgi:hypothetical protein